MDEITALSTALRDVRSTLKVLEGQLEYAKKYDYLWLSKIKRLEKDVANHKVAIEVLRQRILWHDS